MRFKIRKLYSNLGLFENYNTNTNFVNMLDILARRIGLQSFWNIEKVHWLANFATFCFLTTCLLQIVELFRARDDSERFFECFSVLPFCGVGVLKLYTLRLNREDWRDILALMASLEDEQMNSDIEYDSDTEDAKIRLESISSYRRNFVKISILLLRLYIFTTTVYILSPFAEFSLWILCGGEINGNPHILPIWAPLDELSIFGYIITVSGELLSAICCILVHIVFDLTVVGIIIFICGHFSILRHSSERVGGKGEVFNVTNARDDKAHVRIIKCHRTHIVLNNLMTKLDKLVKNILGVYFFVATLTLCSVAIRINSVKMSVMQLISLVQYTCATLIQLFLFCRYGNALLQKSSIGMGQGPYIAAYWCLSPRIRRELLILSVAMMRPRHLHAGPFHSLDLPSFIQIIRAAYSYYAVLGTKEA